MDIEVKEGKPPLPQIEPMSPPLQQRYFHWLMKKLLDILFQKLGLHPS